MTPLVYKKQKKISPCIYIDDAAQDDVDDDEDNEEGTKGENDDDIETV
jgi:hypothetical protein